MDFNPHHCISGDRIETVNDLDGEDFNPHHCISGDTDVDSEADKLEISIHTTASVVTSTFFPYEVVQAISIHTTASVVTPCILMFPVLPEISIHTTASVVTG